VALTEVFVIASADVNRTVLFGLGFAHLHIGLTHIELDGRLSGRQERDAGETYGYRAVGGSDSDVEPRSETRAVGEDNARTIRVGDLNVGKDHVRTTAYIDRNPLWNRRRPRVVNVSVSPGTFVVGQKRT
jgi:hypothetical protein